MELIRGQTERDSPNGRQKSGVSRERVKETYREEIIARRIAPNSEEKRGRRPGAESGRGGEGDL